ncbi:hypothetical protein PoB_007456000 [Plakobranchus ocellatus]|uniref:Uncharacterized protein n=1 Tax=Plakobranchus ocellatus TaxID=259542 RepID=A0AAV4DV72_9GAST|nr:hypothetical protein PoB_007456000 [Plakobranchus ocellatus]
MSGTRIGSEQITGQARFRRCWRQTNPNNADSSCGILSQLLEDPRSNYLAKSDSITSNIRKSKCSRKLKVRQKTIVPERQTKTSPKLAGFQPDATFAFRTWSVLQRQVWPTLAHSGPVRAQHVNERE